MRDLLYSVHAYLRVLLSIMLVGLGMNGWCSERAESAFRELAGALPWQNGGKIILPDLQKGLLASQQAAKVLVGREMSLYRGISLAMSGDLENAVVEYAKAIKADPRNSIAHVALGDYYWRKKSWGDAFKSYQMAIYRVPHPIAYRRLIESYESRGQIADARRSVERWLEVDPKNPYAHLKLGLWLEKDDRKEDALNEFLKVPTDAMETYAATQAKARLKFSQEAVVIDESTLIPPLVFRHENRRDPFIPILRESDPLLVDIRMFIVTGLINSEKGLNALLMNFDKPGIIYILRNGKLYLSDNRIIKGVSGVIETKEVILTQGEFEVRLKLIE